jgi:2-methylisocitrate lyase-like PEP mutase family enzyme
VPSFADLHFRDRPLLLPNAWDVPSALALVDAGFEAVGTTSFGVALSHGHADGARATREPNLALVRALAGLPVPLTVDIEDGYADDPASVAAYVAELGVAGINIEDSTAERLVEPAAHAAKVAAIRARVPHVFINARVDTYWLGQHATVEETLRRAAAYVDAGADGVFVPGAAEPHVLASLTAAIPAPVNTLAVPGLSLDELFSLGVRRVSTGSLPYRAALAAAVAVPRAVRDAAPVPPAERYDALQALMRAYDIDQETRSGATGGV